MRAIECVLVHNIFKNLTFQRRPRALVWRKGLIDPWTHLSGCNDGDLCSGSRPA